MMLRRQMIDEIGRFDEETFGAGYGEENDLCIRARKAGWRLLIADDTYVFHNQSRSYGHERRLTLVAPADEALARKHDHNSLILPYVVRARDSLLLQHVRSRLRTSLLLEQLNAAGKREYAGRRVAFYPAGCKRWGGRKSDFSRGDRRAVLSVWILG